ncbi:hypothetical protein NX059_011064 [Plenodomus lindquistii]|nr:hypothetical protein NX059_011064 [Plenodomus lindquistii]
MADNTTATPSIAIIGLSFRLPGAANSPSTLWDLLATGAPAWTPVPPTRWNEPAFYHPNPDDPNGTTNHRGGHFISSPLDTFDHSFFQHTRPQASATDPQQRLLLELTYEALESGGIRKEDASGTATSVHTACFTLDYDRLLYRDSLDMPVYTSAATEKAMLANRISHFFNLRGPSLTLDTACSGGLVALHLACQSLRNGESNMAVAAAANLMLGPEFLANLSSLHMMSATGRCYPFDVRGDGYGRGEGVVVFVLKRLEDAVRDRDPIRAVIRGSGIGQDGFTPKGVTYPNGAAQADLMRETYRRAGLRPEDVVYVEAHGTGTKAGDGEELGGIADVFATKARVGNEAQTLYVGSIKGAMGHTESVSGLASLAKATVMLERGLIPPVAGFENAKPELPLDGICIPTKVLPWPESAVPRISINSFGYGGANAHVIVERGPSPIPRPDNIDHVSPNLFVLSADSPVSLKALIQSYYSWIEQQQDLDTLLTDLSYTLLHRRSALPYRFSVVAETRASLVTALSEGSSTPSKRSAQPEDLDVFFVFTGQGAQWAGMGRELLLLDSKTQAGTLTIFRDSIQKSGQILHNLGSTWDLETELLRSPCTSRLNEAELAQPATSAIQIALLALLRAQGIQPRAVVGHSSGEIAAAYAAGYLSHETAIRIAFHRGFMAQAVRNKGLGRGAMLSVGASEQQAEAYLENLTRGTAAVACINSPRSVTLSGDAAAIDEVVERIAAADKGIFNRKLLVDTAYHSHHMRAVAQDYTARLGVVPVETPALDSPPVVFTSSVTGELKTAGFDAAYWVTNLVSPVRFAAAVQTAARHTHHPDHHTVFVEVGPHPSLSGAVRQNLQHPDVPRSSFDYYAPLQRKVGAVASVLGLAGKVFEHGLPVDWHAVSALCPGADAAVVRHDLPTYTWDHSVKHWYESRASRAFRLREEPYHDLVGAAVANATDIEPRWRHFLSLGTLPWLADHVVDGLIVFPGAGYICMAVEAVAQIARSRFPDKAVETFVLADVSLKRALVVSTLSSQRVETQLSLRPVPASVSGLQYRFAVSALADTGEWYEHATGIIDATLFASTPNEDANSHFLIEKLTELPPGSEVVYKDALYADLHSVGNAYGPTFAGLEYVKIAPDASLASSSLAVPDVQASMPAQYQQPHMIHPSTLDIVVQTALPLIGRRLGAGSVMPVHIDEVLIAVDSRLHQPGSKLDVSTKLTSSHFRTAFADMAVLADGQRVLSVSGLEARSLAALDSSALGKNERKICYQVDWNPDLDYIRTTDLPEKASLNDIVGAIAAKHHGLRTVGLGCGVNMTAKVLDVIEDNDNVVISHDFVETTPARFDEATGRFEDRSFAVHLRTLRPQASLNDTVASGLQGSSYDVVLAASPTWLGHAAALVKPGGSVVLVLGARDAKTMMTMPVRLEQQVRFHDETQGKTVVVARPKSTAHLPAKVRIFTHSDKTQENKAAWVSALENRLRTRHVATTISTLSPSAVEELQTAINAHDSDDTILVIEDQPDQPILNDVETFAASTALLGLPQARVVWLSPDDPPPFHAITGVSRTAHAENGGLRLATVHASASVLASSTESDEFARLSDVVLDSLSQVADVETAHTEREYRVNDNGAVLTPRLRRNEKLNTDVTMSNGKSVLETEESTFVDANRPLIASLHDPGLFVDDVEAQATALGALDIEVQVRALVLPKTGGESAGNDKVAEYAGVISRIGADVKELAPGDSVVALGSVVGASCLRVPVAHTARLSPQVTPAVAAALLLDAMAAVHVLQDLACYKNATVLVHDALSTAGRAMVALARSYGLRITATAADATGARLLDNQLGIAGPDVLVHRRSLYRHLPSDMFPHGIDAVIDANSSGESSGEHAVPSEALAYIKPFGKLVILGRLLHMQEAAKAISPNVTVQLIDMESLVLARPDLKPALITAAAALLEHIPLTGHDLSVHDVSDAAEALRLVSSGRITKSVLQAGPGSTVHVLKEASERSWRDEEATYVVSGGLGDLGKRFLVKMAERGAKHLVVLSRRKVDCQTHQDLQARLEAIRPGVQLYLLQCDITSEDSVQAAIDELERQGTPPVRGVIQSAAIMDADQLVEAMTHQGFTDAIKPKVSGTIMLLSKFSSPHLSFFLSLSSLAGILGAGGLASYNAGNTVQDAMTYSGRSSASKPTRILSIDIGWIEDAVQTKDDSVRQQNLRRAGATPIYSGELAAFFDCILGAAMDPSIYSSGQLVIGFDVDSLAGVTASNGNAHSALFTQVHHSSQQTAEAKGANEQVQGPTFDQVVAGGNAEAVSSFIASSMTTQLSRLISVEASAIDPRQGSILALGLDSLVAVELRNWVKRHFDAQLQVAEILANQTVHALAEKVSLRSSKVILAVAASA